MPLTKPVHAPQTSNAVPLGGEVVLHCRAGFVRRLLGLLEMDRLLRICTPEEWRQHVAAVN